MKPFHSGSHFIFVAAVSLVLAAELECPVDQVKITLLGGVRNEAFCHVSGSCGKSPYHHSHDLDGVLMHSSVAMPEKWSNQMELIGMQGKTCAAFFK